jgi:general secretion pathway protein M
MNLKDITSWWFKLPQREKSLITVASAMVVFLLVWLFAVSPAVQTIRSFDSNYKAQERKLQQMLNLQSQAQALQNLPRVSQPAAVTALETSIETLFGNRAEIIFNGGNATVNIRGASAEELSQWLNNIRTNARTVAVQARLNRTNLGWNGSFQLVLPTL